MRSMVVAGLLVVLVLIAGIVAALMVREAADTVGPREPATSVTPDDRSSSTPDASDPTPNERATDETASTRRANGRVVDEAGRPIPGASVRLLAPGDEMHPTAFQAKSDAEGRYGLEIHETAGDDAAGEGGRAAWHVTAWAPGKGSGLSDGFAIDGTDDVDVSDIVLAGPGSIEGRVAAPNGNPVPGYLLTYMWSGPIEGQPQKTAVEANPSGLRRGTIRTGDDGEFRLTGLDEGWFVFRHERGPSARIRSGDRDASIVVDRHELRVRVRTIDGRTVPGVSLAWWLYRADSRSRFDAMAAAEVPDLSTADASSAQSMGESAEATIHAREGATVLVRVDHPDYIPAEATVEIGFGESSSEVELVIEDASAPRRTGQLRLTLKDETGAPVTGQRVAATLLRGVLGEDVLGGEPVPDDGLLPPIPEGSYRIHVPAASGSLRMNFSVVEHVEIVAGRTTDLEVTLRRGGRAGFFFRIPDEPEEGQLGEGGSNDLFGLVSLRSAADGSVHENIKLATEADDGSLRFGWVFADRPAFSGRLLEPGIYDATIMIRDFLPVERTITIAPGRSDVMEVELSRTSGRRKDGG